MNFKGDQKRILLIASFSLMFTYLLSFLFEGRILYAFLQKYDEKPFLYIFVPMAAHFMGLFFGGRGIKSERQAQRHIILSSGVCLLLNIPFFFPPTKLWLLLLVICAVALGCSVASWGYFLKYWIPPRERLKACADLLIVSNLLMIFIDIVATYLSFYAGFFLTLLFLGMGAFLASKMPLSARSEQIPPEESLETRGSVKRTLSVLFVFIAIITVNSGLMYQVFNPAFTDLANLASWYWAMPYIVALAIIRLYLSKTRQSFLLYAGMIMMILSFLGFMFLDRSLLSYLLIDTLMLGACGIFDLFWWSILGEMLQYTSRPARLFGIGLSANVFGVLLGGLLGQGALAWDFTAAHIAVLALLVACITLALLPFLNRQLLLLLEHHAWQISYGWDKNTTEMGAADNRPRPELLEPLSMREEQILRLILEGKNNNEIAAMLFISENTVKSHVRGIFIKHQVKNRSQLFGLYMEGP